MPSMNNAKIGLLLLLLANSTSPLMAVSCGREDVEYNRTLSIVSIFVVLVVSFAGFMTPAMLVIQKHPFFKMMVLACTFGSTAVLFTVGIVHILGDADDDLSNPCLPQAFLDAFPSWSDLFACITIMLCLMLDFLMHSAIANRMDAAAAAQTNDAEKAKAHSHQGGDDDEDVWGAELPKGVDASVVRYAVLFVEVSVCTHSIPVGLDLGLQSSDNFVALFIAVIFHQILEGFGVGAAVMNAGYNMKMHVVFALFFALTAPLGIAIGVGLQGVLNTNSPEYLMTLGIVNSIAAGMLIYVAFEHMNAFRTKGEWLRKQGVATHLVCFGGFIVAGAALLVVAKWA